MKEDWQGQFGDEYTKRNTPDVALRYRIFSKILKGITPMNIVEVGCNKGVNMFAMHALFPYAEITGTEVNKAILHDGVPPFAIKETHDGLKNIELIFTCGVLIHIPPKDIESFVESIVKSASHYIMVIEYYAKEETEVIYRGKKDMLWKRDYGKLFRAAGCKLLSTGEAPEIDNATYWLFNKYKKGYVKV